jgi:hypothetical protein
VGVQTFNEEVSQRISRRQNYEKLEDNFLFLRRETGVHIHADLILGLPGETLESFAAGFDRLIALGPQEIQVGILKRLRGTPIVRHDAEWQVIYNPHPPCEILQNKLIDFATMQRLRRFARYWDLVGNSGNFVETAPLIWGTSSPGLRPPSPPLPTEERDGERRRVASQLKTADEIANRSPFHAFLHFSDWLHARTGRTDSIALVRLMELQLDTRRVAKTLWRDYQRGGRHDRPGFLKDFLTDEKVVPLRKAKTALPKRQARHLV